jgi:hypothetical protein
MNWPKLTAGAADIQARAWYKNVNVVKIGDKYVQVVRFRRSVDETEDPGSCIDRIARPEVQSMR